MKNATRVFVSTFGAIMALAGIEHGIGEVLQGNIAPNEIMILSWPESEFFHSLGGEPAMTVVPNLLLTGILAIMVSIALLIWSVLFVHKKNVGQVMILLSILMLLMGGGIFPPIFGTMIGVIATRIQRPVRSSRIGGSDGFLNFLAKIWPWSYVACILAWLALIPGIPIFSFFFGVDNPTFILVILSFAFGTLLLTVFSSFAHDRQLLAGDTGHLIS